MSTLPEFKHQNSDMVTAFITEVLAHPNEPEHSYYRKLVSYEDGHYRVIFDLHYFTTAETPTKSQWNSLKKKLKRHDKRIFVLKDHGTTSCDTSDELCGYVEFGYFAH